MINLGILEKVEYLLLKVEEVVFITISGVMTTELSRVIE